MTLVVNGSSVTNNHPFFLSFMCFWRQAAELLGHPHLQPYVLKIHLKISGPRQNTLPGHWPESNCMKKTRFLSPEDDPVSIYRHKWDSFSNDRNLNPSISGAEQDSHCSTLEIDCMPDHLNQRLAELCVGDSHEVKSIHKPVVSRTSSIAKTSRLTSSKASATHKKSVEPSKNHKAVRQAGVMFYCLLHGIFMKQT